MSKLDGAMKQYMAHIVHEEHRPFSYKDFLHFEVAGVEYNMGYGTFRNKVRLLIKEGAVELSYYSVLAFYTLKGVKFGKQMTSNHTGVPYSHSHPIVKIIRSLSFDKAALHDIHLRFQAKGCWPLLSESPTHEPHPISKDIRLPLVIPGEPRIRLTVHKTDTVTVVVGCSNGPIALDVGGLIRLSNALTRVKERLSKRLENCSKSFAADSELCEEEVLSVIPDHKSWLVTLWHFGIDALTEYAGEKFSATWEIGQSELIRVYSKEFHGTMHERGLRPNSSKKTRVRVEIQERPQTTLENSIKNILQREAGYYNRLID